MSQLSEGGKKKPTLAETKGIEMASGKKGIYQQAISRLEESITVHGRRKKLAICSYAIRVMTT